MKKSEPGRTVRGRDEVIKQDNKIEEEEKVYEEIRMKTNS